MKVFLKLVLVILIFISTQASYAETLSLKLDEVINLTLKENPELKFERLKSEVGEAGIIISKAYPNPSLTTNSNLADNTYEILGVSQPLEFGYKKHFRIQVAKNELSLVNNAINQKNWDVRKRVIQLFTNLYISQKKLEAYQKMINNNEKLKNIAIKREKAGDITIIDVNQASVEYLKLQNLIDLEKAQMLKVQKSLNYNLNLPIDTEIIAQELNILETFNDNYLDQGLIETAKSNSFELKEILLEKDLSSSRLKLAKANRMPSLTLSSGVAYAKETNRVSAFIGAGLEIPLFYRQKGEIEKEKANINIQEYKKLSLQKKINADITSKALELKQLTSILLRNKKDIIPLQQDIIEKTRIRYQIGRDPLIISLQAQQEYLKLILDNLETIEKYQLKIVELEYLVGKPLF